MKIITLVLILFILALPVAGAPKPSIVGGGDNPIEAINSTIPSVIHGYFMRYSLPGLSKTKAVSVSVEKTECTEWWSKKYSVYGIAHITTTDSSCYDCRFSVAVQIDGQGHIIVREINAIK